MTTQLPAGLVRCIYITAEFGASNTEGSWCLPKAPLGLHSPCCPQHGSYCLAHSAGRRLFVIPSPVISLRVWLHCGICCPTAMNAPISRHPSCLCLQICLTDLKKVMLFGFNYWFEAEALLLVKNGISKDSFPNMKQLPPFAEEHKKRLWHWYFTFKMKINSRSWYCRGLIFS